ncbi:hypothetical protein PILCRDRAFT_812535 [Piloderma croceum F 1598]|uniref:Uncharacterized protein n=1 Tax=Piloderma croceum (strain F 1598) TaxID=765440 RepID=A0A0C3GDE8_PILCF|nr:hypothetical protein PILCRDRAFT_812535 [Piloderma croceum F 1598]
MVENLSVSHFIINNSDNIAVTSKLNVSNCPAVYRQTSLYEIDTHISRRVVHFVNPTSRMKVMSETTRLL